MAKVSKGTKMMQNAESQRVYRRRNYLEALEIKKLVRLIPVEIQELPDCDLTLSGKTLTAKVWVWSHHATKADAVVRTLKMAGVIGLTSKFSDYDNTWSMKNGKLQLADGYTLNVIIYGTEKPPECEIREKRETKEVITYEAICKESGQPVGA